VINFSFYLNNPSREESKDFPNVFHVSEFVTETTTKDIFTWFDGYKIHLNWIDDTSTFMTLLDMDKLPEFLSYLQSSNNKNYRIELLKEFRKVKYIYISF